MSANSKTTARVVGVLFLVATISYATGTQLLQSLDAGRIRVVLGALLVLVDAAAVVGIAIALFPILKRHNESIALGYVAFRIIEATLLVVGVLGPLSLMSLSPESSAAGTVAAQFNYWAYQLAMALLGVCGLMLCVLLLQSKLVPRWLSLLGLVGYPVLSVGAVLDMLGLVETLNGAGMALLVPGGLFEIVLPVWLIVKGFGANAVSSSDAGGAAASGYTQA